jgi:hypothetical protein
MAILNAHFRVPEAVAARAPRLLGVLGADVQWVFRRGDVLSVTVSAAEATAAWALPKDEALSRLWAETALAAGLGDAAPLARRLVRERAATFDQSPAGAALRPGLRTGLANVALAGDHVRTGLPASLEGAVRSGYAAAAWARAGSARALADRRGGSRAAGPPPSPTRLEASRLRRDGSSVPGRRTRVTVPAGGFRGAPRRRCAGRARSAGRMPVPPCAFAGFDARVHAAAARGRRRCDEFLVYEASSRRP